MMPQTIEQKKIADEEAELKMLLVAVEKEIDELIETRKNIMDT